MTTMQKLLAQCGFTKYEQEILVFLLQHSAASARTISTATKIKRPTTYLTLEGLIEYGIVTKRTQGKTTVFTTIPRETLPNVLRTRAQAKLKVVEHATEQLQESISRLTPVPSVHLGGLTVESIESGQGLLREMYECLLAGDFVGIFNPQLLQGSDARRLIVDYLQRTCVSQPRIREILVDGPQCAWYRSQIKNPNHRVRVMPSDCKYLTDLILVDGVIVLIDYSPTSPAAVKITHQNLYNSFQVLFEEMWQALEDSGPRKASPPLRSRTSRRRG
jgi:hypothetical protein